MKKIALLLVLAVSIASCSKSVTLEKTASFSSGTGFDSFTSSSISQSDGKIIVVGDFTNYNGVSAKHIIRLNTDGSTDYTFITGAGFDGQANTVALQPDGKILVGGNFGNYNGYASKNIVRLNANGAIDNSFASGTGFSFNGGSGSFVQAVLLQPDGKVLVGGGFTDYNGSPAKNIARLNSTGSIDNTFVTGTGILGYVYALALQTDNKILIGGYFSSYNTNAANGIVRVNANGSTDNTFSVTSNQVNSIRSIAVQADGKVIASGNFSITSVGHIVTSGAARFATDGSLDNTFHCFLDADVRSILIAPNNKIIAVGGFEFYNQVAVNQVATLDTNGTLVSNFGTGFDASGTVQNVSLNYDRTAVIVTGEFTTYNGTVANRIAKIAL